MRRGAVTFGPIAALMIVLLLAPPSASQGVVFWEDDFENHLGENWSLTPADGARYPDGDNPGISTDVAHSGTHSLKGHYTGLDSGRWLDRFYPTTNEVWTRFYYRTTNFTYNNVGTKHFNLGDSVHYPNFWLMHGNQSDREFWIGGQNLVVGGNFFPNVASVPIADDRWYCIETRIKMNTPGVADGVLAIWVDGTQTMNYTGLSLRPATDGGPGQASSLATFNFVRIFVQHGVGDMYYDDFAVGAARIGCGSTSFRQITSPMPSPPTQPQVR